MAEIKTRILLRNDTLANWEAANSVTLKPGEVAIATLDGNLAEVRVGNNTNWAASRKLRVEASQISGLIETINTQVNGLAQEYQLTAGTGADANKWFLQNRPLSGGDWQTTSTLDLTQLTGFALSADVTTLVAAVAAETLTSANAFTDAAVDALNIDNYMLTSTFNAISNEIGLSAASASNPVVTKDDIADLAGAMHFRGAVSDPSEITDPAAGDIIIIPSTSKEYVYNGTEWIELGDEVLYATKAEVAGVSAELTADIAGLTADVDYLSGVVDDTRATLNTVSSDYLTSADKTGLETLIGTVSAETLLSANDYTDKAIDALDIEGYALSTDVDARVAAVSAETLVSANAYTDAAIDALDIEDYALSADVNSLVAAVSAESLVSANAYTDAAIEALDIEDYALSTDVDTLVAAVSAEFLESLVSANAYTDAAIEALNIEDYALSTDVDTLVGNVSAETLVSANAYADATVAALSIDDYIKHGEVTSDDLSGYFVFDCGGATYRAGEQAATEA